MEPETELPKDMAGRMFVTESGAKSSRLTVHLEGVPMYLYSFFQGAYEDKRRFLCVHPEELSPDEVRQRIRTATKLLPKEILFDYDVPDLFEQAVSLAGFIPVDQDVLEGLWIRASACFTERDYLEQCLDREAERKTRA